MDLDTQSTRSQPSGLEVSKEDREYSHELALFSHTVTLVDLQERITKLEKEQKSLRGLVFQSMKKKKHDIPGGPNG